MNDVLWTPSKARIEASNLHSFKTEVERIWGISISDYSALYQWSIDCPEQFWNSLWTFLGMISETPFDAVLNPGTSMENARWFEGVRMNHAENLLRRRDDGPALIYRCEDSERRVVTWRELYEETSRIVLALREIGVKRGDSVVGVLPNIPEAVAIMLAVNSIGAVWSLCSPDFGATGIADRFSQIKPKVMFACDGYIYKGKDYPILDGIAEVTVSLPSLEKVVVIPLLDGKRMVKAPLNSIAYGDFIAGHTAGTIDFEYLPFDHPSFVLFSSGTTGKPKCILHGAGGVLLQLLKEHRLHYDVKPDDVFFYFTTTGWNMWYWLTTALAAEATVLLYDGSPFHPRKDILFDIADSEGITAFGTSPKYLDLIRKAGLRPRKTHDLGSVRCVLSTGSPLAGELYDYVYADIKKEVCLSSLSGGTEIMTAFATGNPTGPVRRGELQVRALGMKAEVFDDAGRTIVERKGELVCTGPFPSLPLGFLNDPDGARYRASYFECYPRIWHHGDFAELTNYGSMIIHGRSDATLKPGGVRIGTAEIYRPVEQFEVIEDSLVVGQDWDNDCRVILFLRLKDGCLLDDALSDAVRQRIRESTTPRHVPAKIIQVPDIPRTKTGKIAELPVREVIHGRPVKNRESLVNPEALDHFSGLDALGE